MGKTKATGKAANVSVALYDGELQICFDCVRAGSRPGKCMYARYYTEPPDPDDECVFCKQGGTCYYGPAQKAAMESLYERITEEMKKYEEGCENE